MSIETTITIDDQTALDDEGDVLVIVQIDGEGRAHEVHLSPETAIKLAAAIASRLNS